MTHILLCFVVLFKVDFNNVVCVAFFVLCFVVLSVMPDYLHSMYVIVFRFVDFVATHK